MNLLIKIRRFLYQLFWIDKFENKSMFFTLVGKFFMYGYIVSVLLGLISFVLSLDLSTLIFVCAIFLLYPVMYRFLIGIQRYFHKL